MSVSVSVLAIRLIEEDTFASPTGDGITICTQISAPFVLNRYFNTQGIGQAGDRIRNTSLIIKQRFADGANHSVLVQKENSGILPAATRMPQGNCTLGVRFFMRGFRFWSWLRSPEDLSAADTEASRRTREKTAGTLGKKIVAGNKISLSFL